MNPEPRFDLTRVFSYAMRPMKSAYMIIAHGSRAKQSNEAFFTFLEKVKKACPKRFIQGAFLELAKPSIPEAVDLCVAEGAEEIFVIPLMFFPGRHVKEDIPKFIQEAKEKYMNLDFHYAGPIADNPALVDLLKGQIEQ